MDTVVPLPGALSIPTRPPTDARSRRSAQPEPGALAHCLGREERLERPVDDLLRPSAALVGHRDFEIFAGWISPTALAVNSLVSRQDRQPPLAIIASGVDRKVQDGVLQLVDIDETGQALGIEQGRNRSVRHNVRSSNSRIPPPVPRCRRARAAMARTGERQQTPGQRRGTRRPLHRIGQMDRHFAEGTV